MNASGSEGAAPYSPVVDIDHAARLARETIYTRDEWQHALNVLGKSADALLPTVQRYAVRQGLTPSAAAAQVLSATLLCPDCGAILQPMPNVGCHAGEGCTHGCLNCGMHWTNTDDVRLRKHS